MSAIYEFSQQLHGICLELGPESEYREIYQAIVCGAKLQSPQFIQTFKNSGLIHIIVVSGSHLVFLSDLLCRIKLRSKILHTVILAVYVCICQFQPPAMRSFVVFCLASLDKERALHIPPFYLHTLAILICLVAFPTWHSSLSLKLSILASIGLCLAKGHQKQCFIIFLLLLPILSFSGMQFTSVINNILFSQIIGIVLFPLSLVVTLLPFLSPLGDIVWFISIFSLNTMNDFLITAPQNYYALPKENPMHWIYICIALAFIKK